MTSSKDREQLIAGYLFDELDDADRARFNMLLERGEIDQREIADLQETLAIASLHEPADPPQEFWQNFYLSLVQRAETRRRTAFSYRVREWVTDLRQTVHTPREATLTRLKRNPQFRWITQAGLVVAVLLVGVLLGRTVFTPDGDTGQTPSSTRTGYDAPLASAAAHEYLGRSKTLLLGIVHADGQDPTALNLPRRSEMARELVRTAADIKPSLDNADLRRLHELVSEIEMILIQIANLEAENDFPAIDIVRQGVERKGLLFKINVEEMRRLEEEGATESGSVDDSDDANTGRS